MTTEPSRSLVRTALLTMASIAIGVVALELGSRAFWRFEHQLPFRQPWHVLHAYYPELKATDAIRPHRGDGHYNVLILAESVLHHVWGEVEPALAERLAAAGVTNARIFNFAVPAQTTRDSRLKYEALENSSFDLVILYHGINESRANNAPPDLFRSDYSHYSWYDTVNTLAPYHGTARFALPYTIKYAGVVARTRQGRYVPVDEPRPDWIQYGHDVRTAASLEDNMTAILDLARRRGDPVMLMTFAIHVPANYSRAAFDQHALDYRLHRLPLEVWGRPDNVVAAVAAHNAVIRRLAAHRPGVVFVDQEALMEKSARMFDDPCHLTIEGSVSFADHIMDALRPQFH
jgi:hypothetical protein